MWEHKGFKIHVDNAGVFMADSEDEHFEAATLAEVKKLIDKAETKDLKKRPIALHVILLLGDESNKRGFSSSEHCIETAYATITGFNRTSRRYTGFDLPKNRYVIDAIPDTEFNRQLVVQVLKAREARYEMERALQARLMGGTVGGYQTVAPNQYEFHLQKIEERYAKALAEDTKPGLVITQLG